MENNMGKKKLNDELLDQVSGGTDNVVGGMVGNNDGTVQNCYNTGSCQPQSGSLPGQQFNLV